ncbi:MAG: hypothetical protein QGI33_01405 [Candidatus Brocadiia bacterium]|nr:hypothetical protein [Candidatus Brocadiia bacterium]
MAGKKRGRATDAEISYRFGLFGRERYVLREQDVEIFLGGLIEANHYVLGLDTLDPQPSRYRALPRRWLSASLLLGVCAVVLAVLCAQRPALGLNAWVWALPALALLGSAAALAHALAIRQNCVTFHRIDDGSPAVNLQWRKPDPEAFDHFVRKMQDRIEACRGNPAEGGLAAELRGLDLLLREGRLSEQEFRAAKAMLLGMEPWQLEE